MELRERGPAILELAFESHHPLTPALAYVALTVNDLDFLRDVLVQDLHMVELPGDGLHQPEHESHWGLPDAQREQALFRSGSVLLEVSRYRVPHSSPRRNDSLLSDQGFQNIAIGFRTPDELTSAYERLLRRGGTCPVDPPSASGGVYITLPDSLSIELLCSPRQLDPHYGLSPLPLLGQPSTWPREITD